MRRNFSLFGFGHKESSGAGDGPQPGDLVKVAFSRAGETETMWVQVTGKHGRRYAGTLDNEPVVIHKSLGDKVTFSRSQIVEGPGMRSNPAEDLRKENESLKRRLEQIADAAAASRDGDEDENELVEKLNTVIDLAEGVE